MEIEKNIMATLKREMDRRGVSYAGFSEEIGIPRSTLQSYLKGTSCPRADSLEALADKLGLSVAELVSGEECPSHTGISCLDQVLAEIPLLHPRALVIAQEAVSLLQTAFQMSNDLHGIETPDVDEQFPEAVYQYCLHEMRDDSHDVPIYGILVKEHCQDRWVTVSLIAAFSHDGDAVLHLIERCTRLQLSPEHLLDVVQDFLTQQVLTI